MEKVLRGRVLKLYEDDRDILEDALIEVRQAIEALFNVHVTKVNTLNVKSKPTRTKEYLRNRKFMRSRFGIDVQEV